MSFTMISSLNAYAKNMKMQMKWEQRRANGDYSHDNNLALVQKIKEDASGLVGGMGVNNIGEPTGGSSHQSIMSGIRAKLNAGKRLSSSELEYLKKNDPETYQHVKAMEAERKAYEQRLRRCKTKEEVQRLKASQMASSLDRVRDVNNNPNIPGGEKLKLTLEEHQKVSAVTDATTKFAESGEYRKLPTEAEKAKAEKDLKEAKEAERKGETKDDKNKVTHEKSSDTEEVKDGERDAAEADQATEAASRTAAAAQETTISGNTYKKDIRQASKGKPADAQLAKAKKIRRASQKTRVEAELTPEAQKVRRSRARAAYAQSMQSNEVVITVDVKK